MGTAILFESSGGQVDKVAHLPELRFALGEPEVETTTFDNAAAALEASGFFIRKVGTDGLRTHHQATLKKVVSDRRAPQVALRPWMMRAFGMLARLKGLRGTVLDPFGYTQERRGERRLIERYEQTVASLIGDLDHTNHALAVEIASLPERIRGFGHVKARSIEEAERREADLLPRFKAAVEPPDAA